MHIPQGTQGSPVSAASSPKGWVGTVGKGRYTVGTVDICRLTFFPAAAGTHVDVSYLRSNGSASCKSDHIGSEVGRGKLE